MAHDVVIAGGGFGGLYAARRLERRLPRHGQHKAVAIMFGVRLRGFPAWFAARTYHLAMMPGLGRKVRLGLDWAVGLPFGRAAAQLGQLGHPDPLERHPEESSAP